MILGSVVSTPRGTLVKGHSIRNGTEKHWTGEDDGAGHKGPRIQVWHRGHLGSAPFGQYRRHLHVAGRVPLTDQLFWR